MLPKYSKHAKQLMIFVYSSVNKHLIWSPCALLVQSLLSRADNKVKELRQSIDLLKAESEKLEVNFYFPLSFNCLPVSFN